MTLYSSNKVVYQLSQLAQLQQGHQPYPSHVQLVISDYCQQHCSFCSYRLPDYNSNELFPVITEGVINSNPKRLIPYNKVCEIVDSCARMQIKAIELTGGGEPTLHPKFLEICNQITSKNIKIGLVTNGLVLRPDSKAFQAVLKNTWIRISLDAGCETSYAKIRNVPPEQYHTVLNNITALCAITPRPVVGAGFVVTIDNYREILQAVKTIKGTGCDNVRISAMFQNHGSNYYSPEILCNIESQLKECEKLNDASFTVYNNFPSRYSDLEQQNPDYDTCGYMHIKTYIGGDLNVYTCCVQSYSEYGKVGSLLNQTFQELWESQAKIAMFNNFNARQCNMCMFNNQNRIIESIIHPDPKVHPDFV